MAAFSAQAKVTSRKPVAPVKSGGIIYSAGGDGVDQYVVATDALTDQELWKVRVFHTHIRFWMEPDVQIVFITNLKLIRNSLFVRDERSRCYSIDLARRRVKKRQCQGLFSQ